MWTPRRNWRIGSAHIPCPVRSMVASLLSNSVSIQPSTLQAWSLTGAGVLPSWPSQGSSSSLCVRVDRRLLAFLGLDVTSPSPRWINPSLRISQQHRALRTRSACFAICGKKSRSTPSLASTLGSSGKLGKPLARDSGVLVRENFRSKSCAAAVAFGVGARDDLCRRESSLLGLPDS